MVRCVAIQINRVNGAQTSKVKMAGISESFRSSIDLDGSSTNLPALRRQLRDRVIAFELANISSTSSPWPMSVPR